jgi:hypothetical protein
MSHEPPNQNSVKQKYSSSSSAAAAAALLSSLFRICHQESP